MIATVTVVVSYNYGLSYIIVKVAVGVAVGVTVAFKVVVAVVHAGMVTVMIANTGNRAC